MCGIEKHSTGGGARSYAHCDGDVLMTLLAREKRIANSAEMVELLDTSSNVRFVAVTWNACGMEAVSVNNAVEMMEDFR